MEKRNDRSTAVAGRLANQQRVPASWAANTCQGAATGQAVAAELVSDNVYDYRGRLLAVRAYSSGTPADKSEYRYDPLARPIRKTATENGATTTTDMIYLGVPRSDALANLALSSDPLTQNRCAYTAANPINCVELDGHRAANISGCSVRTPQPGPLGRRVRPVGSLGLLSMETTVEMTAEAAGERWRESERRVGELAVLSAQVSALTARWLELAVELGEDGDVEDPARFLAFRCGVTVREAREYLRVGAALRELPLIRAAFARGELTFSKVRALTRVATPSCEESLFELAGVLTASQLERALRAFQRVATEDARRSQELEFVSYQFEEDGSLYLRARLPAEDGMLVVKALEAARERVHQRRREERAGAAREEPMSAVEPPRSARVEALLELAETSLAASREGEGGGERARLVVHVDAAALAAAGEGRCELEEGPVISLETARRLGCDAELVARLERDGLPLSVGRARRTVPPGLRRLLEARDEHTCCFPGCERRWHLQAHHRRHWAQGGQTSLENLVLLCFQHHRLVHEGGYAIEDDRAGGLRFRNRHGVVCGTQPPRPPPVSAEQALADNQRLGLTIGPRTNRHGDGDPLDLALAVEAIANAVGREREGRAPPT